MCIQRLLAYQKGKNPQMHIMQADPTRFEMCIMQTHAVIMSSGNKYSQVTE